jgi:processing peptidase subunit alpha
MPLSGHKPIERHDESHEYTVTSLENGFTVLTESQSFPGAVHMGFLIDVGSRDETRETSGSLLALKNTYLKTLKHTNETINYGMIQMSGGAMTMDFDPERTYFKGHCIQYDVIDMFQMMVDIALEPRSVLAGNVARMKNHKSHDLFKHLAKFDPFATNTELLLRTAYGFKGLGMPRLGTEKNVDNIDARMLQQFIMDNITPRKCLIVASGVKNHKEYVDLTKERLGGLYPVPEHEFQREPSEYIGGEFRQWSETPATSITLAFESCPWTSPDLHTYYVMNQLIGSATAFSSGGPGKGMHCRAITNLMQKNPYVDGASGLVHHFTDTGLFGITIEGSGSHSQDLMNLCIEELNALKEPIDEVELNRAKNILKMNVLMAMERTEDRLEEIARNFMTFGDLTFHQYCDKIDAVTSSDINSVATKLLAGKPTLLVTGGAINMVSSAADVSRQLN